jgi:hypothetical protein
MRSKIADIKVLFLITGSAQEPYLSLRCSGQEKTWIKTVQRYPLVEYRYLVSDGSQNVKFSARKNLESFGPTDLKLQPSALSREFSDELIFRSSFGWESILGNLIGGFDWALREMPGWNFIIRTNVSSYWNIEATLNLLNGLPTANLYAGNLVSALNTQFVAGDGIFLSRDVVSTICENAHLIDAGVIDDVAIGRLMNHLKIPVKHIPRRWVRTRFDVNHPDLLIGNTHHFRCKFERTLMGRSWRRDIMLMKALHSKFKVFPK